MRIVIENADQRDFNELAQLARIGRIHTFYMTDEEERPQGKWIGKGRDSRGYCACFECSNCGAYIYPLSLEKELDYNGCPYCFADMRGDDK